MELNIQLNPELMLEIVESYFEHCPTEPKREGEMINPIIKRIHELLVLICKMIPGSIDALFYMAKVNYLVGDNEMAKQLVTECLNIEPGFVDVIKKKNGNNIYNLYKIMVIEYIFYSSFVYFFMYKIYIYL